MLATIYGLKLHHVVVMQLIVPQDNPSTYNYHQRYSYSIGEQFRMLQEMRFFTKKMINYLVMWQTIPSEVFLHHVIPYLSPEELLRIRRVNKFYEHLIQQTATLHQLRMCRLIAQIDQYQYISDQISKHIQISSLVKGPFSVSLSLVLIINACFGNDILSKRRPKHRVIIFVNYCLLVIFFLICLPFAPLVHFLFKCVTLCLQWKIQHFYSLQSK